MGDLLRPERQDVIYVVDNQRGIDVLTVKRGKIRKAQRRGRGAVKAPLLRAWTKRGRRSDATAHQTHGFACRLPAAP